MQKPRVIELSSKVDKRGSTKNPANQGAAPTAGGTTAPVNVSSSGSGMQSAGSAVVPGLSTNPMLPRSQTAPGDGRHRSTTAGTSPGAGNRQQQQHGARVPHSTGGAGGFFLPPPLDVYSSQQGTGSSSHAHNGHAVVSSTTPPPSPATGAPDASRVGQGLGVGAEVGGSLGGSDAANVRASQSGMAARHSAGGSGAVTVFDRKVYVSVYADGPTKVLCFSDDPLWTGSSEADEGGDTLQLVSRLHHVARQLMTVDRQLELYQGAAYGLKPGRGARAVPALLLLQHQQQLAGGAAAGAAHRGSVVRVGDAAQQQHQQELPVLLQGVPGAGAAAGSGSTATAALALLQQMGRPRVENSQARAPAVGCGSLATVGLGGSSDSMTLSTDAVLWAPAAAAAALGLGIHGYGAEAAAAHDALGPAAVRQTATAAALSPQAALSQSYASGRPLVGAAAAAAAGVRVAGGLLGAEGGLGGGVKLYYDKLTLLLDSQLPLGGNVKVGP